MGQFFDAMSVLCQGREGRRRWLDVGFLCGLVLVFMAVVVENESCKGLLLFCAVRALEPPEAGPEKWSDKGVPFFGDASTAGKVGLVQVGTDHGVEFRNVDHGSNEEGNEEAIEKAGL